MTGKATAADLRERFGSVTSGSRALTVAPSPPDEVPLGRRRADGPARFTVELPRQQHRFVKQFALSADTDASTVTRILFRLLEEDPQLAERIRSAVQP